MRSLLCPKADRSLQDKEFCWLPTILVIVQGLRAISLVFLAWSFYEKSYLGGEGSTSSPLLFLLWAKAHLSWLSWASALYCPRSPVPQAGRGVRRGNWACWELLCTSHEATKGHEQISLIVRLPCIQSGWIPHIRTSSGEISVQQQEQTVVTGAVWGCADGSSRKRQQEKAECNGYGRISQPAAERVCL